MTVQERSMGAVVPPPGTAFEAALAEARAARRLVVVVQEPEWCNGAKRLRFVLANDPVLREAFASRAVLVEVDPFHEPLLDEQLRAAAVLGGAALTPPLMVILSPEGEFLAAYNGMTFEGAPETALGERQVSLNAVLRAAEEFMEARRGHGASVAAGPDWESLPPALAPDARARVADPEPRALNPFHLLNLIADGRRDQAAAFVLRALSGGVWDHAFGGFHRGARENRLVLPQFEKPVVHNLAMAMVLSALADAGAGPARIVVASRRQRRFLSELLAGSDEVLAEESDTQRHSWRAREFSAAAGSASSYVGGVYFGIVQSESPLVLYEARSREMTAQTCGLSVAEVDRQIEALEARLAAFKAERHPLLRVRSTAPFDRLSTLWLALRLAEAGGGLVLGLDQQETAAAALGELDQADEVDMGTAALRVLVSERLAASSSDGNDPRKRVEALATKLIAAHVDVDSGWCRENGMIRVGVFDGLRLPVVGLVIAALRRAAHCCDDGDWLAAAARVEGRYGRLTAAAPAHAQSFFWLSSSGG